MSLTTCPDCNGSVSSAAPACPHCGRSMAAATAQTTKGSKFLDPAENARGCLRAVAIVFALGLLLAAFVVAKMLAVF